MSHEIIEKITEGLQVYTVSGGGSVKARVFFRYQPDGRTIAVFHEYGSSPRATEVCGGGYDVQGHALSKILSAYDQDLGSIAEALYPVRLDGGWQFLLADLGYSVRQIC